MLRALPGGKSSTERATILPTVSPCLSARLAEPLLRQGSCSIAEQC